MNNKTPKGKKIADVTRVEKTETESSAPQIVIQKRAHLSADPGPAPAEAEDVPANAPTAVKATITPPAATVSPQTTKAPETPSTGSTTKKITPPEPATEEPVTTPEQPATTTAPEQEENTTDETTKPGESDAAKKSEAERKAQEAQKRQGEIQSYIDTRQFFVPINGMAHKRSIKATLWLMFVYILLSVVLIDLMLDSGMIDLIRKIPHTHFFSV